MPRLMMGDDLLLLRADDPRLPLEPPYDAVDRLVEVRQGHRVLPLTRRVERCLVDQIRQIGPDEPGRPARDDGQIEARSQRDLPGVDLEDLLPALEMRPDDDDLPVEPPWPQERRVEDLRPIRGRQDDHAG